MKAICVFCGSGHGARQSYTDAAIRTGQALAQQGISLVWGGGRAGLMGAVADAVLDAGGQTFGVIPTFMADRELAHPDSTEMVEVDSMHTRKALMADRADGFIALPGGLGTADELFEILTWAQLRLHAKPVGLLNVEGYFDGLLAWINHARQEGFVRGATPLLHVADNPAELIAAMRAHQPLGGDWVDEASLARRR
jgi:hypothetical protein